jgi:hypothetical protein
VGEYVLGLDLETDSPDAAKAKITEIGLVVWDIKGKCPVVINDFLIKHDGLVLSPENVALTGITAEYLAEFGIDESVAMVTIYGLISRPDVLAIVAHNGTRFDEPILGRTMGEYGINLWDTKTPWVDTMIDIDFPPPIGGYSRKLSHLCSDHGFLLDGFAHRAPIDVLGMLRFFSMYDADTLIALASSPRIDVQAMVSYEDRERASKAGYRWIDRAWRKTIHECQLSQEQEARKGLFRVMKV